VREPFTLTRRCYGEKGSGAEVPYLWVAKSSNPGVGGRLDSCTVSSFGATPLTPLEDAFMLMGCSSGSLLAPSSLTGLRDVGAGDELWTTMAGVDEISGFLSWVRSEFRRDRERVSELGGGDFSRGVVGQWGVLSPELVPDVDLSGLGTLEGSCVAAGGSWGMFAEDSARWMAAAEGTVLLGPV
jgi:hypothetical protein